jgi:predicted ATPase
MRIRGETVWLVPTLRSDEANQLFIERAHASHPQLTWSEGDTEHVAHICRRLDGIPLAIELAAARVPSLGLAQISARLNERLRVLSHGSRLDSPRHQTLRAERASDLGVVVRWRERHGGETSRPAGALVAGHQQRSTRAAARAARKCSFDALGWHARSAVR